MSEVYKVSDGKTIDYVSSNSMNQALMNARALFGEGTTVSAELATTEETNALLMAHSFPTTEY